LYNNLFVLLDTDEQNRLEKAVSCVVNKPKLEQWDTAFIEATIESDDIKEEEDDVAASYRYNTANRYAHGYSQLGGAGSSAQQSLQLQQAQASHQAQLQAHVNYIENMKKQKADDDIANKKKSLTEKIFGKYK